MEKSKMNKITFYFKKQSEDKLNTPCEIKTESPDFHSENYESSIQCYDEIEIGKEFKTEPLNDLKPGEDNKLVYCKKCKKNWKLDSAEKRETTCRTCEPALTYQCEKCPIKTIDNLELTRHIKQKHSLGNSTLYKCDKCSKCYSHKGSLQIHLKLCGQPKTSESSQIWFVCDYFQHKTNKKTYLSDHIQAKHLPLDPNLHRCKKFGKSYSSFSSLRKHLQLCGKPKDSRPSLPSLSCSHCKYKNYYKQCLELHIQTKHQPRGRNSQCEIFVKHAEKVTPG